MRLRHVVPVAAILATLFLSSVGAANEGTVRVLASAKLPSGREGTTAVWTGSQVYVFGGYDGSQCLDQILKFDPLRDEIATLTYKLPEGRHGMASFWDGTYAYLVGGSKCPGFTNEILRFDPATGEVRKMNATLYKTQGENTAQSPLYYASAVWTGAEGFIFGGVNNLAHFRDIWRYDASSDAIERMAAQMVPGRGETAAVWWTDRAYIFGGFAAGTSGNPSTPTAEILRYDPGTDQIEVLPVGLPTPVRAPSAAFTGEWAYVFGGLSEAGPRGQIVRVHGPTNTVQLDAMLPSGRQRTSAAWTGQAIYVFGGATSSGTLDEIVKFVPGVEPTPTITATGGPSPPNDGDGVPGLGAGAFLAAVGAAVSLARSRRRH